MPLGTRPAPAVCSMESEKVVAACQKHWDANKSDCSGFIKAVADDLGVPLSGQANHIVDFIQQNWWTLADGNEAMMWAEAGYFVIGGLKADGNGHVVVVVPGPLAHGKYPTAYWGSLGGEGKKAETINFSWTTSDRDKVVYCGTKIMV